MIHYVNSCFKPFLIVSSTQISESTTNYNQSTTKYTNIWILWWMYKLHLLSQSEIRHVNFTQTANVITGSFCTKLNCSIGCFPILLLSKGCTVYVTIRALSLALAINGSPSPQTKELVGVCIYMQGCFPFTFIPS